MASVKTLSIAAAAVLALAPGAYAQGSSGSSGGSSGSGSSVSGSGSSAGGTGGTGSTLGGAGSGPAGSRHLTLDRQSAPRSSPRAAGRGTGLLRGPPCHASLTATG